MANIRLVNVGATSVVKKKIELSLLKKEDEAAEDVAATLAHKEPIIHTVSTAEHSEGAAAADPRRAADVRRDTQCCDLLFCMNKSGLMKMSLFMTVQRGVLTSKRLRLSVHLFVRCFFCFFEDV